MAEYRPIKVKMWHDGWFLKLSQPDKLLWIFLLTNEYVHISGVYELPLTLITPYTGIEDPLKALTRFEQEGKIMYREGWIYICNYLFNQTNQINKKDNIVKSIIAYLSENPTPCTLFDLKNKDPYKGLGIPLGKEERGKRKEERGKADEVGDKSPQPVDNRRRAESEPMAIKELLRK